MNIKKNKDWFLALLLHCGLFQNCFPSHSETLEEVLRFCSANGHGYITLLDQGAKAYHLSMKSSTYDVRIKIFVKEENFALGTMDTLIVQKDMISLQFDDILEIMNTRERQKSILVLQESEVEEFKVSLTSVLLI